MRMKKNPRRVTMFGASHNGRSSTDAAHYRQNELAANVDESKCDYAHNIAKYI